MVPLAPDAHSSNTLDHSFANANVLQPMNSCGRVFFLPRMRDGRSASRVTAAAMSLTATIASLDGADALDVVRSSVNHRSSRAWPQ